MQRKPRDKKASLLHNGNVRGIVIIRANTGLPLTGILTDICRDKLVFRYCAKSEEPLSIRQIDIIWADYVMANHLKRLPVRTLSDVAFVGKDGNCHDALRLHTVKFGNLSLSQKGQVSKLVREQSGSREVCRIRLVCSLKKLLKSMIESEASRFEDETNNLSKTLFY